MHQIVLRDDIGSRQQTKVWVELETCTYENLANKKAKLTPEEKQKSRENGKEEKAKHVFSIMLQN